MLILRLEYESDSMHFIFNKNKICIRYVILHSLICRVLLLLLLLLLLLRNASDLRNCTSYVGACMWVRYCRPPIGSASFQPGLAGSETRQLCHQTRHLKTRPGTCELRPATYSLRTGTGTAAPATPHFVVFNR